MARMLLKALHVSDHVVRRAVVVLGVLLVGAILAPEPAWADSPKIIAMGDLHGDYDAFLALMSQAGLIDAKGHWSGKKATFVQLGDVVDRGPKSRDIILHLQRLQKEASQAGGKVITLIGNHEAMNMTNDLRYVPPAEFQNYVTRNSEAAREQVFQANKSKLEAEERMQNPQITDAEIKAKFQEKYPLGYVEQRLAWAPNGDIGRWVLSNPVAVIVGDSLFVHGGISIKYDVDTLTQLNDMVHAALSTAATDDDAILEDQVGPLWYRGFAEENDTTVKDIADVLKAYSVKRMVIAHTPNLSGIKVLDQGRVVLIDTGITASYGGTRSFLSIEGSSIYAHDNGKITELTSAESPP
jgi:Calcineurin-like phosphoesterase